jgi:hypothetical protein
MLTRVLIIHVLKVSAVLLSLAALVVGLVFGAEHALGVVVGGAILLLDGGGLVYLVGRLLDPTMATSMKGGFTLLLIAKLTFVAGLLYWVLIGVGVSGLGVLLGIGAGLIGLVVGVTQGSASPEGKAAIADAEAKIREEMGDNAADSR